MTAAPRVSVLLPVRNGDPWFAAALESILSQEGVDFEVVVVDDGSKDGTTAHLAACGDPRLRVIRREGEGLVAALNTALEAARGDYVARMDADDLSLPGRLARQARVLDQQPDVVMVHSAVQVIDGQGRRQMVIAADQITPEQRRAALLGEYPARPIIHPSVMMRRAELLAVGGYRHSPSCEDHELWLRVVDSWVFHAIPEVLLLYRQHDQGISRSRAAEQAISHITNCVAYRYRAASGIDLYRDDPGRYAWLRERVTEKAGAMIAAVVHAKAARRHLRQGSWGKGATSLAALVRTGRLTMLSNRFHLRAFLKVEDRVLRRHLLAVDAAKGETADDPAAD